MQKKESIHANRLILANPHPILRRLVKFITFRKSWNCLLCNGNAFRYISSYSMWVCQFILHNWLEIPKVVTLPRFLMEHPVSFMYIHNNYVKILKRRKKNFGGFYWDSCPRSPRDRQSRPNPPKTLKKFITVKYAQWTISIRWYKVHLYILVLHFYLSKIVRTKHLHQ